MAHRLPVGSLLEGVDQLVHLLGFTGLTHQHLIEALQLVRDVRGIPFFSLVDFVVFRRVYREAQLFGSICQQRCRRFLNRYGMPHEKTLCSAFGLSSLRLGESRLHRSCIDSVNGHSESSVGSVAAAFKIFPFQLFIVPAVVGGICRF